MQFDFQFCYTTETGGIILQKTLKEGFWMKIQKNLFTDYQRITAMTKEEMPGILSLAIQHLLYAKDKQGNRLVNTKYLKARSLTDGVDIEYEPAPKERETLQAIAEEHDVDVDQVVNFALFAYCIFKKKHIIDLNWDTQRMLVALDTCKDVEVQGVKIDNTTNDEFIVLDECPLCHHELPAVYSNETKSAFCFKGSCDLYDVWDILSKCHGGFKKAVEATWDAAIVNFGENKKKAEAWSAKRVSSTPKKDSSSRQAAARRSNYNITPYLLDTIKKNCDQQAGYEYMYKNGFKKKDLLECDVYYRDGYISPHYGESNDFRYHLIYLTRDLDGNPVGVNGRSVIDDDEKRREFVENDAYWQSVLNGITDDKLRAKKLNKLRHKTMNNYNYSRGEHLYLLHKYKHLMDDYRNSFTPKVIVTEGPKDAVRVYSYIKNLKTMAVTSPISADLSARHIELLKMVFTEKAEIVLAYDQDTEGIKKNLSNGEKLEAAGFTNVRYLRYRDNFKDFGAMNCREYTEHLVRSTLQDTHTRSSYIEKMRQRGFSV